MREVKKFHCGHFIHYIGLTRQDCDELLRGDGDSVICKDVTPGEVVWIFGGETDADLDRILAEHGIDVEPN